MCRSIVPERDERTSTHLAFAAGSGCFGGVAAAGRLGGITSTAVLLLSAPLDDSDDDAQPAQKTR